MKHPPPLKSAALCALVILLTACEGYRYTTTPEDVAQSRKECSEDRALPALKRWSREYDRKIVRWLGETPINARDRSIAVEYLRHVADDIRNLDAAVPLAGCVAEYVVTRSINHYYQGTFTRDTTTAYTLNFPAAQSEPLCIDVELVFPRSGRHAVTRWPMRSEDGSGTLLHPHGFGAGSNRVCTNQ